MKYYCHKNAQFVAKLRIIFKVCKKFVGNHVNEKENILNK